MPLISLCMRMQGEALLAALAVMKYGYMMKEPDSSGRCTGTALIRYELHHGALPWYHSRLFLSEGYPHRRDHPSCRSSQLEYPGSNLIELLLL